MWLIARPPNGYHVSWHSRKAPTIDRDHVQRDIIFSPRMRPIPVHPTGQVPMMLFLMAYVNLVISTAWPRWKKLSLINKSSYITVKLII